MTGKVTPVTSWPVGPGRQTGTLDTPRRLLGSPKDSAVAIRSQTQSIIKPVVLWDILETLAEMYRFPGHPNFLKTTSWFKFVFWDLLKTARSRRGDTISGSKCHQTSSPLGYPRDIGRDVSFPGPPKLSQDSKRVLVRSLRLPVVRRLFYLNFLLM